jgi:hypothetical protein
MINDLHSQFSWKNPNQLLRKKKLTEGVGWFIVLEKLVKQLAISEICWQFPIETAAPLAVLGQQYGAAVSTVS